MKVLGWDCGGTSCKALSWDSDTGATTSGSAGPGNWASTPRETLVANLEASFKEVGSPSVEAVCVCMAGVLTESDRSDLSDIVGRVTSCPQVRIEPDFVAVLAACPEGTNLAVIAGTGSTVFGWQGTEILKTGGGGPFLGDFGSGTDIGRRYLQKVLGLGAENHPADPEILKRIFETDDPNEVIRKIYQSSTPAALIASLAPGILNNFGVSEPARESVAEAMQELAGIIMRHSDTLELTEIKLGLGGGLWGSKTCEKLLEEFLGRLTDKSVTIMRPEVEPVMGAVRLAMKSIA